MDYRIVFDFVSYDIGTIPDWIAALGTVGAVIVALFQQKITNYFYKPKLHLSIKNEEPWCISVPQVDFIEQPEKIAVYPYILDARNSITESISITNGEISASKKIKATPNGKAIYLGIKIENIGNKTAEHVQVFVKNFKCIEGMLKGEEWPLAMDLQWGNTGDAFYPQIHPNTERYCNIGIIDEPSSRSHDPRYFYDDKKGEKYENGQPALLINVKYPLRKADHIVGPGEYELELIVTAVGAILVRRTLKIKFEKWHDDEKKMLESITLTLKDE